jgi:hypothetical protein
VKRLQTPRAPVPALVLALVPFLALAGGCQSGGEHPPQWKSAELAPPSESVLWAVAGQELQRIGFPVGSDADPASLVIRTGWRTQLAPFRGKGHRERAEARIVELEAEKGSGARYRVEIRVERENNMDVVDPIDPTRAKWEEAPDDVETAQVVLHRIRSRLGNSFEVGDPSRPAKAERAR